MMRSVFFAAASLSFPTLCFAAPSLIVEPISMVQEESIPRGAQRVEFLRVPLSMKCGGEDAILRSITVHHGGFGDRRDIARVYAMIEGKRVSTVHAFDDEQEATIRFRRLRVPACETQTLTIAVDFAADAMVSGQHSVSIDSPDDIDASPGRVALVRADDTLDTHRIVPYTSGEVTVTPLSLTRRIHYGLNQVLGRFQLEATGDTDQGVTAITFTNDGSAKDGDITRLVLTTRQGVITETAARMDGEHVRIEFSEPFIIERHDMHLVELRGTVNVGRTRTIEFIVEEPADVEAHDIRPRR